MTAAEREALERLCAAADMIAVAREDLKSRAPLVKGAQRDLGMLQSRAVKLSKELVETIPPEQRKSWNAGIENLRYWVGIRQPATPMRKDTGIWLSFDVIDQLIDVCREHCMMCALDKGQRRACPLRKALRTIPNNIDERSDGDCEFYSVI